MFDCENDRRFVVYYLKSYHGKRIIKSKIGYLCVVVVQMRSTCFCRRDIQKWLYVHKGVVILVYVKTHIGTILFEICLVANCFQKPKILKGQSCC